MNHTKSVLAKMRLAGDPDGFLQFAIDDCELLCDELQSQPEKSPVTIMRLKSSIKTALGSLDAGRREIYRDYFFKSLKKDLS